MGIRTALDLACADAEAIRDRFGITLSMTVRELQGTSCIPLELVKPKDSKFCEAAASVI